MRCVIRRNSSALVMVMMMVVASRADPACVVHHNRGPMEVLRVIQILHEVTIGNVYHAAAQIVGSGRLRGNHDTPHVQRGTILGALQHD
uniref:Putative secreted peptide n=1 Tax=Anopheles braziliensis TaxID=58242 RepID=A0A2M3ZPB4_9DIPT